MFVIAAESVLGVAVDLLGYSDRGLLILAETRALVILAVGFGEHPAWLDLGSAGPWSGADRDGKIGVLARHGLVGEDPRHGDV